MHDAFCFRVSLNQCYSRHRKKRTQLSVVCGRSGAPKGAFPWLHMPPIIPKKNPKRGPNDSWLHSCIVYAPSLLSKHSFFGTWLLSSPLQHRPFSLPSCPALLPYHPPPNGRPTGTLYIHNPRTADAGNHERRRGVDARTAFLLAWRLAAKHSAHKTLIETTQSTGVRASRSQVAAAKGGIPTP